MTRLLTIATIVVAGIFTNGSPSLAGPSDGGGTKLAQAEFCVGPVCAEGPGGYRTFRDRGEHESLRREDRDSLRDCRDVEVRERRPDGDVVIRHVWRCRHDRGS